MLNFQGVPEIQAASWQRSLCFVRPDVAPSDTPHSQVFALHRGLAMSACCFCPSWCNWNNSGEVVPCTIQSWSSMSIVTIIVVIIPSNIHSIFPIRWWYPADLSFHMSQYQVGNTSLDSLLDCSVFKVYAISAGRGQSKSARCDGTSAGWLTKNGY